MTEKLLKYASCNDVPAVRPKQLQNTVRDLMKMIINKN